MRSLSAGNGATSEPLISPDSGDLGVQLCIRAVEWDPGKARLNLRKRGVSFADAVIALEDDGALTVRDPFSEEEERWVTMGWTALGACWLLYTPGEAKRYV